MKTFITVAVIYVVVGIWTYGYAYNNSNYQDESMRSLGAASAAVFSPFYWSAKLQEKP